jgi:protocatechuate 3,4-dioxygenase, alpha subunit
MPAATAQQTVGPYWHLLEDPSLADLTRFGAGGSPIVLQGRLFDGEGAPVNDACVELWQADPPASESFPGFGRSGIDATGRFRFRTLKPGPLRGRGNAIEAPHVALAIHARGLTKPLFTCVYFAGEAWNEADPLLALIADPARRASLIAESAGADTWQFDIRFRSGQETVFLEL